MNAPRNTLLSFVVVSLVVLALGVAATIIVDRLTPFDAEWRRFVGPTPAGFAALVILLLALLRLRAGHRDIEDAETRLRHIVESSPDCLAVVNTQQRIVMLNARVEKMFGYSHAELLGREIAELVTAAGRDLLATQLQQAPGSAPAHGLTGKRKDGSEFPVAAFVHPLSTGHDALCVVVLRDTSTLRAAEDSRRAAESKYRNIFDNAAEGIYQCTAEGRFITANPALARMLGYRSPEELMEKITDIKTQVFVEPSKRSEIRMMSEQSGSARGFEHQAYKKDGSIIWLLGNQRVVRDDHNNILYYEGNFEEITKRKKTEEALRESQRSLSTLLSNLPGMAYRCRLDQERTIEFASEAAFELTNYPPTDLVHNRKVTFGQLIHPEDRDAVWRDIQTALAEDRPFQLQYRLQVGGRDKIVWEQGRGVRNSDGTLFLEGLILDITERVRAQEKLRQSEDLFRQLAEHVQGVFWMTDVAMREIIYVNSAYEELWGKSRPSLYKQPRSRFDIIDHRDKERVLEALRHADKHFDQEYRIVRADGSTRWIWDRAFPIANDKGEVYRLAGIASDITERKRLEEDLLQAQKMEAVGRLAGGIAHDFNNLLTVINGYSEMLLAEMPADERQRVLVHDIKVAGDRAAALTSQLLAFSRKQLLIPKVVDVNVLVQATREMIQRLIGEDIACEYQLAGEVAPVLADPVQLQQVIMNLAVNARDAMPRGGKLIFHTEDKAIAAGQLGPETPAGNYVMLSVQDTGCGMDADTKAKLFEPFFTTKEVGKGTGLGLSMVYGIIKQSGGAIEVESEQGQGTTFKLYLPELRAPEPQSGQPAQANGLARGHETILLVEDEELVRGVARKLLQRAGYQVIEASGGQEALDLAARHQGQIDMLLSDVVMPEMNGRELHRKLEEKMPDLKVLFVSGYTDSALLRHGLTDKNINILLKPFAADEFLRLVRETLDKPAPVA